MAIQSNFEYKGTKYDEVTFKLVRVFGSKREGWNAVFAFVASGDEFIEPNFKGLIPVGVEWSDENPYPIMYRAMEQIILNQGFIIQNEQPLELETTIIADEVSVPDMEVKPVKKVKVKKVKADV